MTDISAFLSRVKPEKTPSLVVRRSALIENLDTMQGFCNSAGVRLRAHGKMHKSSTLGQLQVERGAVGLCCQTVEEAEAFAGSGIGDLLVTAPIAPWGADRLAALAKQGTRVAVVADNAGQVDRLAAAARAIGEIIHIVIDVNLGLHRTGCGADDAPALARHVRTCEGVQYEGVQAYLGHLQHLPDSARRRAGTEEAARQLASLVEELKARDLAPSVVTGGGTGTYAFDLAAGVFTELQAGSYAMMDVEYAKCSAPDTTSWPFKSALFIASTVVSAEHKSHATIDAGLKAVSVDGPAAHIVAGAEKGSLWRPLGDEHGAVIHPDFIERMQEIEGDAIDRAAAITAVDMTPDVPWPKRTPRYGDLVFLQPGHCDPTINLYDALLVANEEGRMERWPIDARRKTP